VDSLKLGKAPIGFALAGLQYWFDAAAATSFPRDLTVIQASENNYDEVPLMLISELRYLSRGARPC